ncbi:MAG: hypothetical protein GY838_17290 [bacterium]|nr:hypothetical protein [bacterium]
MVSGVTSKRPSRPVALLAFSALYVLVLLAAFRQTYLENDNLGILYDLQYGHTVSFMSVLLGKVLSFLYLDVSDSIPWYGLVLYFITGAALYLTLVSLDILCRNRWLKSGAFALVLVFFANFIVTLSYNAASMMIGFSCLLALMVYQRSTERPRILVLLGLGFLFAFSYLVRTMGLNAVLLFGAVAVGFEALTRLRTSVRSFVVFLLPLALLYGVDVGIRTYGLSDEYREYKEWNTLRGRFHDFPVAHLNDENPDILQANRWSYIDYRMLMNWVFFDERKYNTETMNNIFEHSVPLPDDNGIMYGAIAGECLEILAEYWRFWIVLTALATFTFLRQQRWAGLLQIAQAGAVLVGGAVMATYLHFPDRVAFPLFLGMVLLAFFLVFRDGIGREETPDAGGPSPAARYLVPVSAILLAIAVTEVPVTAATTARRSTKQVEYYRCIDEIRALEPTFLLMQAGSSLGAQFQDPLRVHKNRLPSVPGGWRIFSPRFYEFLGEHNIKHGRGVIPKLVQGDRAYVVSSGYLARLLVRYVQATHRWRTKVVEIRKLSARTSVYEIRMIRHGSGAKAPQDRETGDS